MYTHPITHRVEAKMWLRVRKGKSSSVGASVGAVAGLVCITPAAGFVTPGWALAIGALGAMWCYGSVVLVNRAHLVDDTLDAFGLHGSGGFVGALLTGIFALDEGLIYTGSFKLLGPLGVSKGLKKRRVWS